MKRFIAKSLLTLIALVVSGTVALAAISLDAAKSQGLVGERPDGLLGAVKHSPDVDSLIAATNKERMAKYQSIAASNQTAVGQVQAVAGQKLIEATPSGQYILNSAGSWQQK